MDKFDIRKAKLISIIGLILFIFIMVIANAYQYLPTETTDIPDVYTTETREQEENLDNNTAEETANQEEEKTSADTNKIVEKANTRENNLERNTSDDNLTHLENISDESEEYSERTEVKTFDKTFAEAKTLVDSKQLVKAITEYQNALTLAENSKQKAACYEEIARIYALAKKYGTALSFAQKAYNTSPSTSREVLLARLYYKTGNADKASDRINNVLRRDFNLDN